MTTFEEYKRDILKMNNLLRGQPTYDQLIWYYSTASYMLEDKIEDKDYIFSITRFVKEWSDRLWQYKDEDDKFYALMYNSLHLEAPHLFGSYMLYLEKDREDKAKFYQPKMRQLNKLRVIDAMQGLEDDKLDLLSISLPPGTGKAQPLYSKVLTPDGFVTMGDIKVGSKVMSASGNICNVTGIYPQGERRIYEITLDDGSKCRCSDNHLWRIRSPLKCSCEPFVIEFAYVNLYWYTLEIEIPKIVNGKESWYGIDNIEYIGEEECQCIMIDDPSHLYITDDYIITHNTTLEKFFTSWVIGRHPDDYNLFFSHSGDITRMYYDGVLDITTSDEYNWSSIFPNVKLMSTDAKRECINFNRYKPFANLQCTSVGSKNAGKVRTNRYLFCDDLIGGIEEALNPNTLDKLWNIYSTDARQRKLNEQVKEIHIATRWATRDIIGRLQTAYEGDDRARFIAIPDIDPLTGESNFDYDFNGMSVKFFNDQALLMDEISYKCLYKNQPIEREGQLFPEDKLRRYFNLPQEECEEITGQVDCKGKGTDFMVMPVLYKFGNDYYMEDCICNNGIDYELQYEELAQMIVFHAMQNCEFESNAGGDRVSLEVNKRVEAKGWICNITDKPTETNKEAKIYQCSNWIIQHILFKDKSLYTPQSAYGKFMSMLCTYSVGSKKQLDDVPDCLSNFAIRKSEAKKHRTTQILRSPI